MVTSTANLGGYRHLIYVPPQNIKQVLLNTYIFQTLTTFAFGTSKFSIGFLILRLIPSSLVGSRRFIWGLIIFTCIYNWTEVVLVWMQCKPRKASWDFNIPATCWSLNAKLANIYVGTGK